MILSPLISAIIVNFNGRRFIGDCLTSLQHQSYPVGEIIVVDNASEDDSADFIKEIFPDVVFVPLTENIGFAGANTEGLRYATGTYILLLNNDAKADENCVSRLVSAMDADPEVGMCAPKILQYDSNVIESAGDGFARNLRGFERGRGLSPDSYDREEYVFGACAGAVLYRRTMLEDIGFLDSDFFLIHEDTDLNVRAQIAGWKVKYIPSAEVRHRVRSSIGRMSDTAIFYSLRNCELVRIKNIPVGVLLRSLPILITGEILEFFYFVVKHRKLLLYIKAKWEVCRLLPEMLKKRRGIIGTQKTNNADFYRMMTPVTDIEFFWSKAKKLLGE